MFGNYRGCSRGKFDDARRARKHKEKLERIEKQKKIDAKKSIDAMLKKLQIDKGYDLFCNYHQRWYTNRGRLTACKNKDDCKLIERQRYEYQQSKLF